MDVRPGDRFGEWTVLEGVPSTDGSPRVRCRCTCGQEGILAVATLIAGASVRCSTCVPRVDPYAPRPKPAPAPPPPEKKVPTNAAPAPRRATIAVPAVKVTLPLRPDQLPRNVLPREGGPSVPIELTIEVAADVGRPALRFRAVVNSRNYRKAVKTIDDYGGNAMVILQGRLTGNGELLDAGIAVQPKAAPQAEKQPATGV